MTATTVAPALPTTMKAARLHQYGGMDGIVFEDAPVPQPGDGQVLVRVHAAGVNPLDVKIIGGAMQQMMPLPLPAVLGGDVAGEVVAIGPNVTFLKPGMSVYGQANMGTAGAFAEYALAAAGSLAQRPRTLTYVQAAGVPIVALTAWQALMVVGGLQRGQTVLIHGAAGNVGSMAVQFASQLHCHVVATAKSEDAAYLHELGATEVVNYQNPPSPHYTTGADLVLDTIGGDTRERSWGALKPGGILVTTTDPASEDDAKKYGVRTAMMQVKPSAMQLDDLAKMLDTGTLKILIGKTFPLSDARRAFELQKTGGTRGKIVLHVAD